MSQFVTICHLSWSAQESHPQTWPYKNLNKRHPEFTVVHLHCCSPFLAEVTMSQGSPKADRGHYTVKYSSLSPATEQKGLQVLGATEPTVADMFCRATLVSQLWHHCPVPWQNRKLGSSSLQPQQRSLCGCASLLDLKTSAWKGGEQTEVHPQCKSALRAGGHIQMQHRRLKGRG